MSTSNYGLDFSNFGFTQMDKLIGSIENMQNALTLPFKNYELCPTVNFAAQMNEKLNYMFNNTFASWSSDIGNSISSLQASFNRMILPSLTGSFSHLAEYNNIFIEQFTKLNISTFEPLQQDINNAFNRLNRATALNHIEVYNLLDSVVESNQEYISELAGSPIEDKEDIVSRDLQIALSDKLNWQQRLIVWIDKYKSKNPVVVWFIIILVTLLIEHALGLVGTAIKDTFLRTEPSSTSTQVTVVDKDSEILIIGEQPYYFKVKFEDEGTGDEYIGWISKRTIETN